MRRWPRPDAEFAKLYSADGRPSIAPERLLRAALIQILFSIRSERQLMEQMQYNLLFRWFVGLGIEAKAKGAAIDGRTTRHAGYVVSQRIRKRIEEPFGWGKTVGPCRNPETTLTSLFGSRHSTAAVPTI